MKGNDDATVLIVEDELLTAESIAELLQEEEYLVTGTARDATTALQLSEQIAPQVAICDISLKGEMNGVSVAAELKKRYQCEIVFLTAHADTKTLTAAFATEPAMYVVKPYNDMQLIVAVQMAFHRLYKRAGTANKRDALQLTEREREIAMLAAEGLTSKQVAQRLFISIETVKTHRRRMLQKNDISNFTQLVYLLKEDA